MPGVLPAAFKSLEPHLAAWALPTTTARVHKRVRTPYADIERFYQDMAPQMPAIMAYLDGYPPQEGELPQDTRNLLLLAKAFTEAAMSVELLHAADEPMVVPIERVTIWP